MADIDQDIAQQLDAIGAGQRERIVREMAAGRRPPHAASVSEVGFAVASAAFAQGIASEQIAV
ncbi:hypothetical protein [Devosia sp.]|uniref:hypothetical protein n=1 Tax=Devosia sp. TaxID=1871048 RepID=UPI002EF50108